MLRDYREGVIRMVRKQVSGYVPEAMKADVEAMKAANPRTSESSLVEEAFTIAMPQLKRRHLRPSHDNPRQVKRA
jgi:hypothetical protein